MSSSWDKTVRLYNIKEKRVYFTIVANKELLCCSTNNIGSKFYYGGLSKNLNCINLKKENLINKELEDETRFEGWLTKIKFY